MIAAALAATRKASAAAAIPLGRPSDAAADTAPPPIGAAGRQRYRRKRYGSHILLSARSSGVSPLGGFLR